jgi:enoyl-[acyl-carrier-protein] reductase (NADH)
MVPFLEEQFSLSGEVAVVTGGTGELCSAMAQGLARAGAKVVLVGRDAAKAETRLESIRNSGGEAVFLPADVTKKAETAKVCAEAVRKFGKVTIAIPPLPSWTSPTRRCSGSSRPITSRSSTDARSSASR